MARSDIIATITSRIAAVTAATPADELASLKVLGTKLGLNTSNIDVQANTASNTASSKDLYDVMLLSQALDKYSPKSYIGELRPISPLAPEDVTYEDGSRWLKQGFYETDSSKVAKEFFPYAIVGSSANNVGSSTFSRSSNTITGECVKLNSGKIISFGYGGFAATVTAFTTPESAGVTIGIGSINVLDYSYDSSTDTLYLLLGGGILYKITSNGTVVTNITETTYLGTTNGSSRSVLARNGIVYVGCLNTIRKSTDGGTSWSNNIFTGIPASTYIHKMAYVESLNKLVVFGKLNSQVMARNISETLEVYVSINDAAFTNIGSFSADMGFVHSIINLNDTLLFLGDYTNGTNSLHTIAMLTPTQTNINFVYSTWITTSPNIRPRLLLSDDKKFVIFTTHISSDSLLKIHACTVLNNTFTFLLTYSTSVYSQICSATGIGRVTTFVANNVLYINNADAGTSVGKKLPLYGILGTNTPYSALRVL